MNARRADLAEGLEDLHRRLNRREWIHPDPLEFVYRYKGARDREIAGLVASCLAYGRVAQILDSVETALNPMGSSPRDFLLGTGGPELGRVYSGFKHRWTTGQELARLLTGIRRVVRRCGSLEACFGAHHRADSETTLAGLEGLVREIDDRPNSLLPAPSKGSACKRLHLYMRWMVRDDEVDPGCWKSVRRGQLVVPLDTHMFGVGRALGFTHRRQANLQAALDLTAAFKAYSPEDPLRYDFALTRLGIRPEMDLETFLAAYG